GGWGRRRTGHVVREGREAEGRDGRHPRRDRLGPRGERRGVREVLRAEGRGVRDSDAGFPGPSYPLHRNPSFVDLVKATEQDAYRAARAAFESSRDPGPGPGAGAGSSALHGTTVLALTFADGVIMAGDRRATEGY